VSSRLERYRAGEHEQVWSELHSLGAAALSDEHRGQAEQVIAETMRRVRGNCEKIVSRLHAMGYRFGIYPDGSAGYYSMGPLFDPNDDGEADIATLESAVGPLPLSLLAFWRIVGSVDLVGMYPGWPRGLDPVVVNPPTAAVSELDEMDEKLDSLGHFEASLAPDDFHKDNVSGGAPYSVQLPCQGADFRLLHERHRLHFVSYLRMGILRFGGFPGIEGREAELASLSVLRRDLEPF